MATIEDLNGVGTVKHQMEMMPKKAFTFTNILLLGWMVQNGLDMVFDTHSLVLMTSTKF